MVSVRHLSPMQLVKLISDNELSPRSPLANAYEEFFVRQSPLYEVVGQLGLWGTIINGVQAAALEHKGIKSTSWNGPVIGLLIAYTAGKGFLLI